MDFEIELTGFEMAEVDFILDEATEIKQAPLLPEDSIPELSASRPSQSVETSGCSVLTAFIAAMRGMNAHTMPS